DLQSHDGPAEGERRRRPRLDDRLHLCPAPGRRLLRLPRCSLCRVSLEPCSRSARACRCPNKSFDPTTRSRAHRRLLDSSTSIALASFHPPLFVPPPAAARRSKKPAPASSPCKARSRRDRSPPCASRSGTTRCDRL